jgi:hypothetical protein
MALLSIATSLGRLFGGDGLWFRPVAGLTPNHKTFAVAMAGALPLIVQLLDSKPGDSWRINGIWARAAQCSFGLALIAIALSASKTAYLTTLVGLGLFWPRPNATISPIRPLSLRPRWVVPTLCLGLLLAYYAPVLIRSKAMLDATRSRHSLNERAWEMFNYQPLIGAGSGMSTEIELITFPHYRVNGVEAHGVIQKVAGETGLVGLFGYGWFMFSTLGALRRRARHEDGLGQAAIGTWVTLHSNLILSTEVFSPTHWVPFAICWGIAHHAHEEQHNGEGP